MNVEIAERLAARRKLAGLSQEALAEKLGVSRQAVSKWERSESSPDTDNLIALAKLYGVSLDELLYVDDAIADDVAFEAADRAEGRRMGATDAAGLVQARTSGGTEPVAGECSDGFDADGTQEASATIDSPETADAKGVSFEKEDRGKVHFGPDGLHVDDGRDHVHISWADGVHVVDRHGQEVHVGWDGVRVNTTDPDAAEHIFTRASMLEDVDAEFAQKWLKFPFWAVVIGVYLLFGIVSSAWWQGLFLLFLIPVYYIVAAAVASGRIAPMLCALYPVGATAWFFLMAFVAGQWHPAWAIFLTIPIVEVLIVRVSTWWRHRKDGEVCP